MDAERQRHLDRLLKLLALAQSTSFGEEADTARRMAEELMAKYNLSIGEGEKEDRGTLKFEYWSPHFKGAQWEYMVVDSLARLCGCKTYFTPGFIQYILVGTISDLEGLRYMISEVGRQRIAAWLDYKRTGPDNLWAFCYAFATALGDKVDTLLVHASEIVAHTAKARLWYESTHAIGHGGEWIHGQGRSAAGRDAGGSVSLHRGAIGNPVYRIGHRRS